MYFDSGHGCVDMGFRLDGFWPGVGLGVEGMYSGILDQDGAVLRDLDLWRTHLWVVEVLTEGSGVGCEH